ncbi:hypothetical protein [Tunturiibacter gelidiferens]|uniref:Uncharacterized protein n=1 Tax=Tunturiibacter gelidiferens TaxID=3069689 RepID=A0AAU7YW64_9BACT
MTDWPTRDDFQAALTAMESDPKISGDGFWAFYAHALECGWQPMVMPTNDIRHVKAAGSDAGQWWSLYYGGIDTLVNSSAEMRARAEMLRSHAFKMAGLPVPPHPVPPAPVITTKSLGIVRWRGSVGAVNYSVERSHARRQLGARLRQVRNGLRRGLAGSRLQRPDGCQISHHRLQR